MKCSTNIFPQPLNILTKRHTATHSPPTLELLQPTLWPGGVMRGNETSTPVLFFFFVDKDVNTRLQGIERSDYNNVVNHELFTSLIVDGNLVVSGMM